MEVGDENNLKGLVLWLFVEVTLVVAHRRETSVYYRRDPDMYFRCEFCYHTVRLASDAANSETSEKEIHSRALDWKLERG